MSRTYLYSGMMYEQDLLVLWYVEQGAGVEDVLPVHDPQPVRVGPGLGSLPHLLRTPTNQRVSSFLLMLQALYVRQEFIYGK